MTGSRKERVLKEEGPQQQLFGLIGGEHRIAAYLQNSAHQMRTPLTVLKTYIELVQAEVYGPVTSEMMEKLETLEVNLDELSYFVDQFQDMGFIAGDIPEGPASTGDLCSLVEMVTLEVAPSARSRNISIELERPDGPVEAALDPPLARKALHHLLRYVIQTAPLRSEIRTALKKGPEKTLIVIFGFGELVNGPEMARILEGMTEIDTNLTNTDWERLSLPLCRTIMQIQGGDLTIFNDERDRTVYVLEFQNVQPS
jgi:signal transduction histidine kinase